MIHLLYSLWLLVFPPRDVWSRPDVSGPRLQAADRSMLLRERYWPGAVERTANQRQRFDARGCWSQSSNLWLWVTDPSLRRSDAPSLYFNNEWPDAWFCLRDDQRRALSEAIRGADWSARVTIESGPVERWSADVRGRRVWAVAPVGEVPVGLEPVVRLLASLGAEAVWGQGPPVDALR